MTYAHLFDVPIGEGDVGNAARVPIVDRRILDVSVARSWRLQGPVFGKLPDCVSRRIVAAGAVGEDNRPRRVLHAGECSAYRRNDRADRVGSAGIVAGLDRVARRPNADGVVRGIVLERRARSKNDVVAVRRGEGIVTGLGYIVRAEIRVLEHPRFGLQKWSQKAVLENHRPRGLGLVHAPNQ